MEESSNTQRTPYLFTAKELDEETGLYYFGARYYDPRVSLWQNPDPLLAAYLNTDKGIGGIHNSKNLALFAYAHHGPLVLVDPDGNSATVAGAVVGGLVGGGIAMWQGKGVREVAGAAAQGAIAGAVVESVIDSGGASLGVIAAAGAGGNVLGGIVGRGISGQETTASSVAVDAAAGALGGAAGQLASRGATAVAGRFGYSAIGSTGAVGENALARLGGDSHVFFRTPLGARYVDRLVNGVAHESKTGYMRLTPDIAKQIAKDAHLVATKQIRGAVWHFFKSPKTGEMGMHPALEQALRNAGIPIVLHPTTIGAGAAATAGAVTSGLDNP